MQKDNISLLFKLLHKLILIAPLTKLSFIPIALKTWLAAILPEEHAEPELTSYPSISKAITKLSAEIFLNAINAYTDFVSLPHNEQICFRLNQLLRIEKAWVVLDLLPIQK